MMKLQLNKLSKRFRKSWRKKGFNSKIKSLFIYTIEIVCLSFIIIITVIKSYTNNFINKHIKVTRKSEILTYNKKINESTTDKKPEEQTKDISKENQEKKEETITNEEKNQENSSNNSISNTSSGSSNTGSVAQSQPVQQAPTQHTTPTYETPNGNAIELEVLQYINSLRNSLGISSLNWNNSLYSYARTRASELITNYSHIRPNGQTSIESAPIRVRTENLAYGQVTASEIYNDWKNSLNHYQNFINNSYTNGAVAYQESNGIKYWVFLAS